MINFKFLLVLPALFVMNLGMAQPKFYKMLAIKGMDRQEAVEFMVGKGVLDIQKSSVDTLVYKTLIDESRFEIVFDQDDKKKVKEFGYYSQSGDYYKDLKKYLIERGLESNVNPSGWEEFAFCEHVDSPTAKKERKLNEKCDSSLYLFMQKNGDKIEYGIIYSDRFEHSKR